MKITRTLYIITVCLLAAAVLSLSAAEKLKVLIVDGQNNHNWRTTTPMLKWILEDCGRFTVAVSTTPPEKSSPDLWKEWHPTFTNYDAVLLNYNGERWPARVNQQFVEYVRNGGGLVVVHAADNAFPDWPEFNDMIAVGGWGGRNEQNGPMIRWRDGKQVLDRTPGDGGTHGAAGPYVVNIIVTNHPITMGLPSGWRHAKDELYGRLRGPCKNFTVLANAFSAKETGGTGEVEPVLLVINYGQGRVFHDVLGHDADSMADTGFQCTLQRGTEWAATGKVTLPAPKPEAMAIDKVVMHQPPR